MRFTKTTSGEYTFNGGDTDYVVYAQQHGWRLMEVGASGKWEDVGHYDSRREAVADAVSRDNAAMRNRTIVQQAADRLRAAGRPDPNGPTPKTPAQRVEDVQRGYEAQRYSAGWHDGYRDGKREVAEALKDVDGETVQAVLRRYADQVAWPHSGYDPGPPIRAWADRIDAALAATAAGGVLR